MNAGTQLSSPSVHELSTHEEEHTLGWWRTYVFSTDHKTIGIQYAISGFIFLFLGFCLVMMMRWQLAYPGKPLPLIGKLFGGQMPGGVMTPEFYNSLGAMHGTIMVFLGGSGWELASHKIWGLSAFGWNVPISSAAWLMGLAQIPFIINFLWSIKHGRKVASDNPWDATTLEWATPTPPPHGNFTQPIVAYRAPYDYSVTGAERDFCPQNEPMPARFEQRKDDPALAALART